MQIPDRVIIDNAGGPSVLVGGTVEAALNAALPLVSVIQADSHAFMPLSAHMPSHCCHACLVTTRQAASGAYTGVQPEVKQRQSDAQGHSRADLVHASSGKHCTAAQALKT